MAEYIERKTAIKNIKEHQCRNCSDIGLCKNCAVLTAIKLFESIPATDVQPVKHGRWEEVHEWMGDVEYSCSVCGCYALWKELTTDQVCTEYCPNCGAKMDGEA